jgi:IclR family acetate operon transcriptional repressor
MAATAKVAGKETQTGGVRSVERSLAILTAFSRERPCLQLDELSAAVGLPKSTTHRLVQTLVDNGFLERGETAGSYRLSVLVARLGGIATYDRSNELIHQALASLRDETGETAGLAILDAGAAVIVDRLVSLQPLRYNIHKGSRLPAHSSSSGRVLLATLDEATIAELHASGQLSLWPEHPVPSLKVLMRQVGAVRDQGYALDDEEFAQGLRCISVSLHGEDGTPYSLGISSVAARLSATELVEFLPRIRSAADEISATFRAEIG